MNTPAIFILGQALNDPIPARMMRILKQLRPQMRAAEFLTAREFFLLKMPAPPAAADKEHLRQLLGADNQPLKRAEHPRFYVLPRAGTRSPWSSKAGAILRDILHTPPEHIERGLVYETNGRKQLHALIKQNICDVMLEELFDADDLPRYFVARAKQGELRHLDMQDKDRLAEINQAQGLALNQKELSYLAGLYAAAGRQATDAELMLFAQLNSEHCRHKVFNASLKISGRTAPSLFTMIKQTTAQAPQDIISAYIDNAAIFASYSASHFYAPPKSRTRPGAASTYRHRRKTKHLILKAETHNHPTFVSPYPGAATGVGGEIRDELACGRGGRAKAGFVGFSVSDLLLGDMPQPWEYDFGLPPHKASSQQIMLQAPIGGCNYANEFGRPNLAGYFRTLCCERDDCQYGYHKPIMLAGGWGEIHAEQAKKGLTTKQSAAIILLGEPALRLGLGGGSVSSTDAGGNQPIDFASVQRDNAEMEKRCAEVIAACAELGQANPIQFIHDLGAGGLGNALAELLKDSGCGGAVDLEAIPIADPAMSPRAILTNESQERFLLTVANSDLAIFDAICRREHVPYAKIGETNASNRIQVRTAAGELAIDLAIEDLFPNAKQSLRISPRVTKARQEEFTTPSADTECLRKHAELVLKLPSVACKAFLITIGDRFVGGLTAREQMIGGHQMPVSDYAATLHDYHGHGGEALALGERAPISVLDAGASASMALGEVIANLAASGIASIQDIKLCANWMAAVEAPGQLHALYQAVKRLTEDLCIPLGLAIPVGKDSLFMRTVWHEGARTEVISPVSLILSGLSPVRDLRLGRTPQLNASGDLWLLTPKRDRANRLGGSALAQVMNCWQGMPPAVSASQIKSFFNTVSSAIHQGLLSAYHDVSDGGLWATLCEMAFASHCGLELDLDQTLPQDIYSVLFAEELGAVVQVAPANAEHLARLAHHDDLLLTRLGRPIKANRIAITRSDGVALQYEMTHLRRIWAELSWRMSRRRDNPDCADQEEELYGDFNYQGLSAQLKCDLSAARRATTILKGVKPQVAILRCQGTNGQRETAAAFDAAGFETVDVPMQDLQNGATLSAYKGVVFCGGFSYGDALGAGMGWAARIMQDEQLRAVFRTFFARPDTFTLGLCNGCQTLAAMEAIIPGADWNCRFALNTSQRYEARTVMTRICDSPSIFLRNMAGSVLPIVTAHAEGRASFAKDKNATLMLSAKKAAMLYADDKGEATMRYPLNPNGSAAAIAGLTTVDGRVTIMMPHPERVFRQITQTWQHPARRAQQNADYSSWQTIFFNARLWLERVYS